MTPVAVCDTCGGRSEVTDTRARPDGIRRRRCCATCGKKWSTIEIRVDDVVVPKNLDRIKALVAELGDAFALPVEEESEDE